MSKSGDIIQRNVLIPGQTKGLYIIRWMWQICETFHYQTKVRFNICRISVVNFLSKLELQASALQVKWWLYIKKMFRPQPFFYLIRMVNSQHSKQPIVQNWGGGELRLHGDNHGNSLDFCHLGLWLMPVITGTVNMTQKQSHSSVSKSDDSIKNIFLMLVRR